MARDGGADAGNRADDAAAATCAPDAGQCAAGEECACGGAGPSAPCACHKKCSSASECSAPDSLCGCSGSGPGLCVSACFCFCG